MRDALRAAAHGKAGGGKRVVSGPFLMRHRWRGRASRESMLMDQFCGTDVLMNHIRTVGTVQACVCDGSHTSRLD